MLFENMHLGKQILILKGGQIKIYRKLQFVYLINKAAYHCDNKSKTLNFYRLFYINQHVISGSKPTLAKPQGQSF